MKVPNAAGTFDASVVAGDFDGDGRTDLALTGATTWRNVPVAFAQRDGSFDLKHAPDDETDEDIARFSLWAAVAGAQILTGDFDGDGRTDLALTGASAWRHLPVAFSRGDGTFRVTSAESSDFPVRAAEPGVTVTTGDFNHDGRTDVALTPGPRSTWSGLPVALSNGDGTFKVVEERLEGFVGRAQEPGVRVTGGDFNGDGRTDLALTGGAKWDSVPVALSNEDGTFKVVEERLEGFAGRAQEPGARVVSGDFDANGMTDLVLTGAVGWTTLPVAWSSGEAHFIVTDAIAADFPKYAAVPGPSITRPGRWYGEPSGLLVSEKMVTVNWFDRSDNERGFRVEKRNKQGQWRVVHQVPTRNVVGSGQGREDYTWVDTERDISGQCYRIAAYNDTEAAYTPELCTVRPDPDVFPQSVAKAARQWDGLSSTNDGTGGLYNKNALSELVYGERTFGVNLGWADTSLWRVQAQGGPHLMKGQAVALRVWGGGWLKYGNQTFGVNLQLSDTPSYEWYVLGDSEDDGWKTYAGQDITTGNYFALWNSAADAYLVKGYQTWGIDLKWYNVSEPPPPPPTNPTPTGIKTYRVVNCTWPEAHTLQIYVKDLSAGSAWVHVGSQQPNWTNYGSCGQTTHSGTPFSWNALVNGHYYELIALDADPEYCPAGYTNPNDSLRCVRMDSTPFLGSTTSSVVVTSTVN